MALSSPEARALLDRARALDEARDYPRLLSLLEGLERDDLHVEPNLAFLFADVLRRVGEGERSLAVLLQLARTCLDRGDDRLNRRRLNLLGSLQFEQGDIDTAVSTWTDLASSASAAGDTEFEARAFNNLGVVATLRGRSEDALVSYNRALAAYHRLGYRRGLGQSHHNLAITYRELGFSRESDSHFREAARFARESGSEDELARVEQERALLILLGGDPALARESASRALDRYEHLEDPAGRGEALRVVGLCRLWERDLPGARESFESALGLARECRATLLEAECLEALAAVADEEDRVREGEALRREVDGVFDALGAPEWGAITRSRIGTVLRREIRGRHPR